MRFVSTRSRAAHFSLSDAIRMGLAPDGGLFIPETVPKLPAFNADLGFSEACSDILREYFVGDKLASELPEMAREAFDFPVPLRQLNRTTSILELFHGPTNAFKDLGARFLAAALNRIPAVGPRTVLVATSGDTGGAVAAALSSYPDIVVGILFPKGRVSRRQQKQLTTWGGSIDAFAVRGSFDDCQRLVKDAFADEKWPGREGLTSANSINIGRLLPQIASFVWPAVQYQRQTGTVPGVIVPTGNLGHAVGAFYARAMGAPIGKIAIAVNANKTISDHFETGAWKPRASVATLANAMDVGAPSNIERLQALVPKWRNLREGAIAISVSDDQIRDTIKRWHAQYGEIFCPHTATAVFMRERLGDGNWIVAATAHPAKFETIVEPLIGAPVPVPPSLRDLISREEKFVEIEPSHAAFKAAWQSA